MRLRIIFVFFLGILVAVPSFSDVQRKDAIQADLADALMRASGAEVIKYLMEKGLDRTDSERIAEELSVKSAGCYLDALSLYANDRALDFEEQLGLLESSLARGSLASYLLTLDIHGLSKFGERCFAEADQAAGIRVQ